MNSFGIFKDSELFGLELEANKCFGNENFHVGIPHPFCVISCSYFTFTQHNKLENSDFFILQLKVPLISSKIDGAIL